MTVLVSDSSTLYSQGQAKEHGIYTVPLNVIVDQQNYREFEDKDRAAGKGGNCRW